MGDIKRTEGEEFAGLGEPDRQPGARFSSERLALVTEIATAIGKELALPELLQSAANGLARVLHVQQVGIALLEGQPPRLSVRSEVCPPGIQSAVGVEIPLVGNPSMERILKTRQSLAIEDAQTDPLLKPIRHLMAQRGIRSILITPMLINDKVIGTIGCDVLDQNKVFSLEEIRLAETLAHLIATRVNLLQLLERSQQTNEELNLLSQILHQLNTPQPASDMLEAVRGGILALAGCSDASLLISTEQNKEFSWLPLAKDFQELDSGKMLPFDSIAQVTECIEQQQVRLFHLEAAEENEFFASFRQQGFSMLRILSFRLGAQRLGALNLVYRSDELHDQVDLAMLKQVSDALGLALERTRLFVQSMRRDQILEVLSYSISQLVLARSLEQVMPELLARLGKALDVTQTLYYSFEDAPSGEKLARLMYGWTVDEIPCLSVDPGYQTIVIDNSGMERFAAALQTGAHIDGNQGLISPAEHKFLQNFGISSFAGTPVIVEGELIGVIGLLDKRKQRSWSEGEHDALHSVANSIGAAIVRLRSETKERRQRQFAEVLRETAASLAETLDQEVVLDRILDGLQRVVPIDSASIMFVENNQTTRIVRYTGYAERGSSLNLPSVRFVIQSVQNLREMYSTQKGVLIPDVRNYPGWNFVPETRWIRSYAGAPIRSRSKVIGFINLDHSQPNFYDQDTMLRLQLFADQAGVALENASLFEETQRLIRRTMLLNQITHDALLAEHPDELLQSMTDRLTYLIDADSLYITTWDEKNLCAQPTAAHRKLNQIYREVKPVPGEWSLTRYVLEHNRAVVVDDVISSPIIPNDMKEGFPDRALLGLPLIASGKKLGAMIFGFVDDHLFTPEEIALCEQAAVQIALMLTRVQLLEMERQQSAQLLRTNTIITALSRVGARVQAAAGPEAVMNALGQALAELDMQCMVGLRQGAGDQLCLRYTSAEKRITSMFARLAGKPLQELLIAPEIFPYYDLVLRQKQPVYSGRMAELLHFFFPQHSLKRIRRMIGTLANISEIKILMLPLIAEEQVIGMLWLWGKELSEADTAAANVFASQVAIAIENARLFTEARRLAITDPLTGLFNRRHFFELARREFDRSRRYVHPLAMVILDVDHFKQVNDTYGHIVGDQALRAVAQRCRLAVREPDLVGRYGGEEFVVLLLETSLADAQQIAERLRSSIAESALMVDDKFVQVTVSVGLAHYTNDCPDVDTLLNRADQALLRAKENGRNQVVAWEQ